MDRTNEVIYDFSNLTANEVEVETTDETKSATDKQSKSIAQTPFFEPADYSNGALYDESNYCWSQTFTEIEIHIRLPKNVTSKNLKVNITYSSIEINATLNGERMQILSGQLSEKCKAPDAMWTITGGNKLNINIDKTKEIWWKKLLQHEKTEIDANQIDCSRPLEELSDETQAQINQIQFDEQQKMKGQPTSEQIKQEELLRKAWNAEGSPFTGPFDPNIVQFQN